MVIDNNKHIEWINKSALKELRIKSIDKLEELEKIEKGLSDKILNLKSGEIKTLTLDRDGVKSEIALNTIVFQISGRRLILVSLKNIHSVLETKEQESWLKLTRVLTHEIMNSMTPIISLSGTLLENKSSEEESREAISAINRRSRGLLDFIQSYRKLTRVPEPKLEEFSVMSLFTDLQNLFANSSINFIFECNPNNLTLNADRTLLEQVLVNLIHNAVDACLDKEDTTILIQAANLSNSKTIISVKDNGEGISPSALDKIFVPFYTTKNGGSGIGLSLCKQIMTLHKGEIKVFSVPNKGSIFELSFY